MVVVRLLEMHFVLAQDKEVPLCQVVPLPAGRVDWVVASLGGPGRTGFVGLEGLIHQQRLIFGQC